MTADDFHCTGMRDQGRGIVSLAGKRCFDARCQHHGTAHKACRGARSGDKGDKGDDANIGVIARQTEYLPYLRAALTPERIADWFSHVMQGQQVMRYDLPGIAAMNFVLKMPWLPG